MPSATIYLIRHAEKPDGAAGGVDQSGAADPDSLIPRGWQRSGAWNVFFGPGGRLPPPDRLYAAGDEKEKTPAGKVGSHSERPTETIGALAGKLGKTVDCEFVKGKEQDLAAALGRLDGVSLVCWQHEAIPQIAILLAGSHASIPAAWPDDRFDVVWRLTRTAASAAWTFDQLRPQLLFGDKATPIA